VFPLIRVYNQSIFTSAQAYRKSSRESKELPSDVHRNHPPRGVAHNHLAALNRVGGEAWYFQDEELRATHLETLANCLVYELTGRIPIGQNR